MKEYIKVDDNTLTERESRTVETQYNYIDVMGEIANIDTKIAALQEKKSKLESIKSEMNKKGIGV